MRVLLTILCAAACALTLLLYHPIGLNLIADDGILWDVDMPSSGYTTLCVLLVCLLTWVVTHQARMWAWPLLLCAYVLWVVVGRVVCVNLVTGEIVGHYYIVPVDHHSLRPPDVPVKQYRCDARVRPGDWTIELWYAGKTESIWAGPLLMGRPATRLGNSFGPC